MNSCATSGDDGNSTVIYSAAATVNGQSSHQGAMRTFGTLHSARVTMKQNRGMSCKHSPSRPSSLRNANAATDSNVLPYGSARFVIVMLHVQSLRRPSSRETWATRWIESARTSKGRDGVPIYIGMEVWFENDDVHYFGTTDECVMQKVGHISAACQFHDDGPDTYKGTHTICCDDREGGNLDFWSSREAFLASQQEEKG